MSDTTRLEHLRNLLIAGSALCGCVAAQSATITIVNLDGANEGFNDPTPVSAEGGNTGTTRGQQRLIVFQTAANIWGAKLQSSQTIKVGANFDSISPCSSGGGVLGFAGPTTFRTLSPVPAGYFANTWYSIAEAEAVRSTELNTTNNEISASFNSDVDAGCLGAGTRFWYGIDSTPVPGGRVALLPTVLHELGHGLGFLTLVDESTGELGSGLPDIWTYFLKNAQTGELWKDMTNAERVASAKSDPNLIWDGPKVTAAIPTFQPTGAGVHVGTGRMRMYAPNPVEPGSSVSHWTDDAASPNLLMEPALSSGVFSQTDLTVPLFEDIGWPLAAGASGSFSIANASITEGNSGTQTLNFVVTRSGGTGSGSVTATTSDATATATGAAPISDYVTKTQVLSFAAAGTQNFAVTINGDTRDEDNETFTVTLSAPSAGFSLGAPSSATGTITDNDNAPTVSINSPAAVTEGTTITFTVSLSAASGKAISVAHTTASGGGASGATEGSDFSDATGTLNFAADETSKTFNVSTTNDTLDEADTETFTATLSAPTNATLGTSSGTGSLNDNDALPSVAIANTSVTEGGNLQFTVTLTPVSGRTVTVPFSTADGTATIANNDYLQTSASIQITAGNTTGQIIINTVGDAVDEADETMIVNLGSPTNATVSDGSATGTILDDDITAAAVSIGDASLTEGNVGSANMVFTVSIPAAVAQATSVTYSTSPIDATSTLDFLAVSGTATITAGNTSTSIGVPIIGDVIDEWDEQFTVNLSATASSTLADGQAVGTIVDDDSGGDPVFRNGFE